MNIHKYINIRHCPTKQTFLMYIVHFLDKNNVNQSTLQPVHSIQLHVLISTFTCADLWSCRMCLFPLPTNTPHELSAVADTHTEHTQMPHERINSHTCKIRVLYYTVVPLYTRRLILERNTVLRFYTSIIISDILANAHKSYFITQD